MATWKEFGKKLDDDAKDVLYSSGIDFMSLKSDDERIDSALSVLHDSPLWGEERYDNLRIMRRDRMYDQKDVDPYSIENASSIIKTWRNQKDGDGKSLTTGDQFYREYWTADKDKRAYWKTKIENELGKGAWDRVKERMNSRLKAEKEAEAEKNRVAYLEGKGEGQGASDWLASAWWRMFGGRSKDKALANKEIKASDIIADVVEDAAMTLPLSAATKLGKVGMALAVPLGSEVLDAALYDENNPSDLPERANFNPVDVGVGGLVNMAAPVAMQRMAKGAMNKIFGRGESSGMSSDLLEAVTDLSKKGKFEKPTGDNMNYVRKEYADGLRNTALDPYKNDFGLKTSEQVREDVNKIIAARDVIASPKANKKAKAAMEDQIDEIIGDDETLRALYESYKNFDNKEAKYIFLAAPSLYDQKINTAVLKKLEETAPYSLEQMKLLKKADQLDAQVTQYDNDWVKAIANYRKGGKYKEPKDNFSENVKIAAGLKSESDDIKKRVLDSDASWLDYQNVLHPQLASRIGKTGEILSVFGANKLGNQRNADRAVAPVEGFLGTPGLISNTVKEAQQGSKERAKENSTKASLVLMAEKAKDPEDKKWLEELAKNPKLAKGQGAVALDPKFRAWMLLKGNDYLRNTDLYRPTFKVE